MSGVPGPIRVVHMQKFSGISGSEGHLQQLLTTMDRARVAPSLVMLGGADDARERTFRTALETAGIPVHRFPILFDIDPALVGRLVRWFRRECPTIVHTHLLHADLHAGLAARLAGVPVLISTKHNDDRFRQREPVRTIERLLARRTDRVITISDALRSFYLRVSSADPSRVTTILYGYAPPGDPAPDAAEARRAAAVPDGAPLILAVGRLVDQKGHDILLRALPLMARHQPEPWLIIAGTGNRGRELARLAEDLGLSGRVRFPGHVDDIRGLMRAATVLAHPARWEGFGLVLLEAMANDLPIVATAVSAIPEVVASGETGLLVAPDDPVALAGALDRVLADGSLRAGLADRGRRRLADVFSPVRMAAEHVQVYEAALARAGAAR